MPAKKRTAVMKRVSGKRKDASLNFSLLVGSIQQVHEQSAAFVNRTVNITLTLRNWVIGAYIREYEQRGADRAKYGAGLVDKLSEALRGRGLSDLAPRTLRQCRQFYVVYPLIWQTVSAKSVTPQPPAPI